MTDQYETLRIALLGMSDNRVTSDLIRFLGDEGIHLDAVILQVPNLRENFRRLKRKIAAAGFADTIQRIRYAMARNAERKLGSEENDVHSDSKNTFFVADANGDDVKQIIRRLDIDVLLLSTDSIIRRSVFSLPRRATLNAHPGRIPQYRGLGGLVTQVSRGMAPSISIHMVNEGVDTGPILLRENLPNRVLSVGRDEREQIVTEWQAKLFARVLRMIASGSAMVVDTFLEPSNMTRGASKEITARAWASANRRVKE